MQSDFTNKQTLLCHWKVGSCRHSSCQELLLSPSYLPGIFVSFEWGKKAKPYEKLMSMITLKWQSQVSAWYRRLYELQTVWDLWGGPDQFSGSLKELRNEGTVFALQTARQLHGSDDHIKINGSPVFNGRSL